MQLLSKFKRRISAIMLVAVCSLYIIPFAAISAEKQKFTVVIDAGHGGSDTGALENGVKEKDINLSVALALGNLIKKKLKDTEVVYTRDVDKFVTLQNRADIANSARADLFISIHCNSVDRNNKNRSNVVGATTYVLGRHKDSENLAVAQRENSVIELEADNATHYSEFDPNSDESYIIFEMTQKKNLQNSVRFASDVQKEMASAGRFSRGVQQAGFWVLWSTAMPAALIELDFLCNPEQAKFLNSKEGQEKLAGAIFNAVKKYENYYRKNLGTASASQHAADYLANYDTPTRTAQAEDEPGEDEPAAANQATGKISRAELPAAQDVPDERRHRASAVDTSKKTNTGAHRRRSAASRTAGASNVEETTIALVAEERVITFADEEDTPVEETAPVKENKKNKKADKKKETKAKKEETSKPARRNRETATTRRGVRQNVNVGYKVLLFVSDDELKASDDAFKGLKKVASFRENNKYKYTYGESEDRAEMEQLLDEISPLFPEARVIKCYY